MRFFSLFIASVLSVLFISGCATSSQQEQLAAQIQQLQQDVGTLQADMETVQKTRRSSFSSGLTGPALDRIAKIKFPQERSDGNLKNYINEIIVANQGVRSYSSQDPQVKMLARVGADNLQLLIDALPIGSSSISGSYHLKQAIQLLADESHKDLILKELPIRQQLVSVVLERGWQEDAREILISEMNDAGGDQLSTDWFRAVASLQDPETYDALTRYFASSMNAGYLYQYISMLPGIQLDDAVAKAWEKAKYSNSNYTVGRMASIAIEYGHQDAVEALIDCIKNPPPHLSSLVNPRLTLLMHLDTKGSNKDIIDWYEANKDNLVFDPESKKFRLKG